MKARGNAGGCDGRKKGALLQGDPEASPRAVQAVRDMRGRLAADPARVAENVRNYFQLEESYARDLFGEPVQPRRGRSGRPRHMPTVATRLRVRELRARGLSLRAIAADLEISLPTLQLNYPVELGSGSSTWRKRLDR